MAKSVTAVKYLYAIYHDQMKGARDRLLKWILGISFFAVLLFHAGVCAVTWHKLYQINVNKDWYVRIGRKLEIYLTILGVCRDIAFAVFSTSMISIAVRFNQLWDRERTRRDVMSFFRCDGALGTVAIVLPSFPKVQRSKAAHEETFEDWKEAHVQTSKNYSREDNESAAFVDIKAAGEIIALFSKVNLPTPILLSDDEAGKILKPYNAPPQPSAPCTPEQEEIAKFRKTIKAFISIGWFSNSLTYYLFQERLSDFLKIQIVMEKGDLERIKLDVPNSTFQPISYPPTETGLPNARTPELVTMAFLELERSQKTSTSPQDKVSVVVFGGFRADGTALMGKYLSDEECRRKIRLLPDLNTRIPLEETEGGKIRNSLVFISTFIDSQKKEIPELLDAREVRLMGYRELPVLTTGVNVSAPAAPEVVTPTA